MTVRELDIRRLDVAPDLAAAIERLAAAVSLDAAATDVVERLEAPFDATVADARHLPAGLPADVDGPRFLLGVHWSGIGTAAEFESDEPARLPAPPPPLRYALTVRFDPARRPAPEWEAFGRCRAWLPVLELDSVQKVVAVNVSAGVDRRQVRGWLRAWRPPAEPARASARLRWQRSPDDRREWTAGVEAALARIADPEARPELRKIVLARRITATLDGVDDPRDLLGAQPLGTVGWPWWIARGDQAWLGETPELLGRRENGTLRTVALAGTRPRDRDPARDQALHDELLSSDKDRREQAAVADWLARQLTTLAGNDPKIGPLSVRRLPSLQHLGRDLLVRGYAHLDDATWLDALHPTPALCGAPRAEVRSWLRTVETFDRGLYGGVVGWLESDRAVAHVAIRGVHCRGDQLTVYAGAGLVRGSDPAREWQETSAKIGAVCHRLGLEPPEVT